MKVTLEILANDFEILIRTLVQVFGTGFLGCMDDSLCNALTDLNLPQYSRDTVGYIFGIMNDDQC